MRMTIFERRAFLGAGTALAIAAATAGLFAAAPALAQQKLTGGGFADDLRPNRWYSAARGQKHTVILRRRLNAFAGTNPQTATILA